MTGDSPREADSTGIPVEVLDHSVVIQPAGEIDLDTASPLRIALTEALTHASPARPVVVDCSRLIFCDSTGLNALLTARHTAQAAGIVIRLAAPQNQLTRLLEMTGALPLFPTDPHPPTDGHTPARHPDGLPQ
ncbi:STAS domain-containing protein [Streptomyces sp. NBC_01351]|uniref:STAS domain-containing protein n=1 Tax=Streptomyces sp. NBC_01351 TaxID=2903833 RepID=UPI002E331764|nr:STAS domain-containing protein [Streptomyces sp. NBC_01351]